MSAFLADGVGLPRSGDSGGTPASGRAGRRRRYLYSASIGIVANDFALMAFSASFVCEQDEFIDRLITQFGEPVAQFAYIARGIDEADPLVRALVARPLRDMLFRAARLPSSRMPEADLHIEQWFDYSRAI